MTHSPQPVLPGDVEAGQAVYTRRTLSLYDLIVLRISNRWIWRCPTPRLLDFYNQHITANHLDVGVGTGYFLDSCTFPSQQPRIVLMDLNENCLVAAGQRIARYAPETEKRNVLEPIEYDGPAFDSIGLNYVLHCLPGDLPHKGQVFDHLLPLLNPGGVLFGSTLLSAGVPRSWPARRLMSVYNRKGIFSNTTDSLETLKAELSKRFEDWRVETAGCGALFAAKR